MSLFGGITHFLGHTLGTLIGTAIGGPLGGILGQFAGDLFNHIFDRVTSFFLDKVGSLVDKFLPAGDARDIFRDAYQSGFKSVLVS